MKSEIFNSNFSDHWVTQKITSNNIKKVALLLTCVLICYHGVLHLTSGVKSCKWLLSDGSFHGFGSYRVWQPYGCMLHTYSKIDIRMCLKYIAYWGGRNHIVFMGDSRIYQLYHEFVEFINSRNLQNELFHKDQKYTEQDLNLIVEFLWRPIVNQSMIDQVKKWNGMKDKPDIIIVGSATHSIRLHNGNLSALEFYRKNLTILLPYIESLNKSTNFLWVLQDPIKPDLSTKSPISNEQIDAYNKVAMEVLRFTTVNTVHVWSSARLVAQGFNDVMSIKDLINSKSLKFSIQILLNLYCNDHMNYNDGTCCSDPEKSTFIQIMALFVFSIFISLSIAIYVYSFFKSKKRHRNYKWTRLKNHHDQYDEDQIIEEAELDSTVSIENFKSSLEVSKKKLVFLMARFGIIMSYFYLCDRTNFFMKENKYFTRPNFFLPIAYVFSLGFFFTDKSGYQSVLNKDQTNEIKGWMQLIILAYHYTGASQVLPIYMSVRLLVSLYLFLSGYGHFTYFWTTADISFTRFWKIVFRQNFLTIFLCLCMNRPYQFYYFVPLVTFWFTIIFITFKVIPHVSNASAEINSSHYFYLTLKLVTVFSLVSLLYTSEVFFENIFLIRPWKALFVNTDDSIKEWWFRWKIDRYSVLFGMVYAFGYQMLKKNNLINDYDLNNLFSFRTNFLLSLISVLGLMACSFSRHPLNHNSFIYFSQFYTGFSFFCQNKSECNEIHPYIAFVPIFSFILLRNISGLFRSRFSLLFSWFGKISLELFICQYHIWLAADTHGILVLIPGYPVLNVVVTSFIFICIAHDIHLITEKITHYSITSDWRYTMRNFGIILLILIPIGIKDGMF